MLAATRDPFLHPAAQPAQPTATGFSRFVSFVQIAGSLLAVPLGLASGYSIYHANFSAEARCQGLRGNIVSMLDKSADASTLRILVRRDVAAFEQSCGAVDPDAVAAFKTLLAHKPVATAHAAAAKPPAKPAAIKQTVAKPVEAKPAVREVSDAKWLASVRAALVSHHAEPAKPAEAAPPEPPAAAPAAPVVPSLRAAAAPVQPMPVPPPMRASVAPAQPAPVASVPRANTDHPVPPALIPEAPAVETPGSSRTGTLLSRVPLIGGMFGR